MPTCHPQSPAPCPRRFSAGPVGPRWATEDGPSASGVRTWGAWRTFRRSLEMSSKISVGGRPQSMLHHRGQRIQLTRLRSWGPLVAVKIGHSRGAEGEGLAGKPRRKAPPRTCGRCPGRRWRAWRRWRGRPPARHPALLLPSPPPPRCRPRPDGVDLIQRGAFWGMLDHDSRDAGVAGRRSQVKFVAFRPARVANRPRWRRRTSPAAGAPRGAPRARWPRARAVPRQRSPAQ